MTDETGGRGPGGRPPARVRVVGPRTAAVRAGRPTPASEIDRRTAVGEVYVATLLRAQLRLALGVLAVLVVVAGGLPLLFHLAPRLTSVLVLGMPLPWVLLAGATYPFLVACGWFYLRRAEANERAFADVVDRDAR